MSYNNIYLVCDEIIPLVFTTWPGHPLSAMIPLAEECRIPDLGGIFCHAEGELVTILKESVSWAGQQ